MGLAWHAAARELFESCDPLLVVSARSFSPPGSTHLEDVVAARAGAEGLYRGIAWRVRAPLDVGLGRLKALLAPGAALLLVIEARRPQQLLRSLLGRSAWPVYVLEDACEALLLQGLGTPRLLAASKAGFAVAATNPVQRSALDVFFEQPLG